MSFEDYRTGQKRHRVGSLTSYKGWIVGSIAALIIIFGVVEMYRHDNNYTPPAATNLPMPVAR